jgi:hypothetical protein
MTPMSEAQFRLAALHKHWLTADSVDHHLRRSMELPEEIPSGMSEEWAQLAALMSGASVMSVWYSLLFVVVEGYLELGCHDAQVDALLTNEENVNSLRRFRNATFHYQEDPLSPKLDDFLATKDSSQWIHNLNRALKAFFERELINNPDLKHIKERFMQRPPEL